MDDTKHKSHHHQKGENHSANDPAIEGTWDYNKQQSMFHLAVLCLGNRNNYINHEWKVIKLFNPVIKYIHCVFLWGFFLANIAVVTEVWKL